MCLPAPTLMTAPADARKTSGASVTTLSGTPSLSESTTTPRSLLILLFVSMTALYSVAIVRPSAIICTVIMTTSSGSVSTSSKFKSIVTDGAARTNNDGDTSSSLSAMLARTVYSNAPLSNRCCSSILSCIRVSVPPLSNTASAPTVPCCVPPT